MLTSYGTSGQASDSATHSLRLNSSREQELMYVALTMVGRSENLMKLVSPGDRDRIAVEKYRTLDDIII
jgi:hypothetical protein